MRKDPTKAVGIVLLAVYLFFFTSKLTLGNILAGDNYKYTELGETFELSEDISVTVIAWREDISTGVMEVELEIVNTRSDMDRSYTLEAYLRSTPEEKPFKIDCEIVLSQDMYMVVWLITEKASWSEAVLRIRDKDRNTLSLYTNRNTVSKADSIELLSYEEYQIRRYTKRIEEIDDRITEIDSLIRYKEELMDNIEKITEEILSTYVVSTEEDLRKRDELIAKNDSQKKALSDELILLQREKKALFSEKELLTMLIEDYEKEASHEKEN